MLEHKHARTALICESAGDPIVSLDDAKAQIRVESDDDDTLIAGLCSVATSTLDGADGSLKRALCTQRWTLVLPSFRFERHRCGREMWGEMWDGAFRDRHRHARIYLPLPPLQTVSTISYTDDTGASQTLDDDLYSVVNCGTEPSFLVPAYGTSWPSTRHAPDAVKITFTAGYGDSPNDVPSPIVHAAKLWLSHLYQNREAVTDGRVNQPFIVPMGVDQLVYNYAIRRF